MTGELLAALNPEATAPLTCGSCRNSPATHLVVADFHVTPSVRAEQLTCKPCADFALSHAGAGDRLYLYRLVPEEAL
jgi:hypothetical protein